MNSLGEITHTSICDCWNCRMAERGPRNYPVYSMGKCWDIIDNWRNGITPPLGKLNRHIFITISLNPKNFNSELIADWLPELSCIENHAIWTYEFYGKNLQFHPHIHLLIKTSKKLDKKRIIKKLSSQFNISSNFIDYKTGNNTHLLTKRVNYIKGIKSESKNLQIIADIKYRDKKI